MIIVIILRQIKVSLHYLMMDTGVNIRNIHSNPCGGWRGQHRVFLRIEMRMEDGECQWKSEREERKKETSAESETVRLAIINHIRCWRRPRILATRQTLRLSSIPISFFC